MHIGLFFGSFNPVHVGHMVLANFMLEYTELEQVWFVVSPQNPLKPRSSLLDQRHRLSLVNIAIGDCAGMKASDIEFKLPQPSYTITTLLHLEERYPQHKFSLIMGKDNLFHFRKWRNYEEILKNYELFVYPRPGIGASEFDNLPNVHLTEAPLMEVSSTFIREALRNKKDIRYFLPLKVWEEIDQMNFYRK